MITDNPNVLLAQTLSDPATYPQEKGPVLLNTGSGVINNYQQQKQDSESEKSQQTETNLQKAQQLWMQQNSENLKRNDSLLKEIDNLFAMSQGGGYISGLPEKTSIENTALTHPTVANATLPDETLAYKNTEVPEKTTSQLLMENSVPMEQMTPEEAWQTLTHAQYTNEYLPAREKLRKEQEDKEFNDFLKKEQEAEENNEIKEMADNYEITATDDVYRKLANGKVFKINDPAQKEEILSKWKSPKMKAYLTAMAIGTAPIEAATVDNVQTPPSKLELARADVMEDALLNGKDIGTELTKAGLDFNKNTNKNTLPDNPTEEDLLKAIKIPAKQEFSSLHKLRDQLVAKNGITDQATLDQIYNDILYSVKNLKERAGQEFGLGSFDDAKYAFNNIEKPANEVAGEIVKQYGYSGNAEVISSLTHILDQYHDKYGGKLPYSIIGMVVKKQLLNDSNRSWSEREDQIGNTNLYIKQDLLGGNKVIEDVLGKLYDKNQAKYEKLKDRFAAIDNYLKDLSPLDAAFTEASAAVNRYIRDVSKWGDNSDMYYFNTWTKADRAKARQKSLNILTTVLPALEKFGQYYNYSERGVPSKEEE